MKPYELASILEVLGFQIIYTNLLASTGSIIAIPRLSQPINRKPYKNKIVAVWETIGDKIHYFATHLVNNTNMTPCLAPYNSFLKDIKKECDAKDIIEDNNGQDNSDNRDIGLNSALDNTSF